MIEINEKQAIATFGTGDIGVGDLTGANGEKQLGFSNQEAREIDAVGDFLKGDKVNTDEFQILFTFTKVESIDVIIRGLQRVKSMLNE